MFGHKWKARTANCSGDQKKLNVWQKYNVNIVRILIDLEEVNYPVVLKSPVIAAGICRYCWEKYS